MSGKQNNLASILPTAIIPQLREKFHPKNNNKENPNEYGPKPASPTR